jgi:hypothetical protein
MEASRLEGHSGLAYGVTRPLNGELEKCSGYDWAPDSTQVYAIGDSPKGPFTYAGKVMEHAASVTQHGSVVEFRGKWYVFYHTSELSNGNSFRRSVCVDELTFAADGRINTVTPTEAGPVPAAASH